MVSQRGDCTAFRAFMDDAIARRWRALWKAMPNERGLDDPNAIHEVRVASRRLRAAMDLAADGHPSRWYRRLHREAKRITRAFGSLRDADVMLEHLRADREHASPDEIPGLESLIAAQEIVRDHALATARHALRRMRRKGLRRRTRKRFPVSSRSELADGPSAPFATDIRATIAAETAGLRRRGPVIADPQAVAAAHEVRIAVKRLRYTIELFAPVLGDDGAGFAGDLKELQDALGALHDRDVLIASVHTRLGALIHARDADTDAVRTSLEARLDRFRQERAALHAAAVAQWGRFDDPDRFASLVPSDGGPRHGA